MSRTLPVLLCLGLALAARQPQNLSDRFKANVATWESGLLKGEATGVRKSLEVFLQQEGSHVNSSDYKETYDLVAALSIAARACALEGAWEDSVGYLQRASITAQANQANIGSSSVLTKFRKEHESKIPEWRDLLSRQEAELKKMDEQPGLTSEQLKARQQLRTSLEEVRTAIANSEKSLKAIDDTIVIIRKQAEVCQKSLADWTDFLAKEKADLVEAGSPEKYVSEKLVQVKADDARPRFERLAYGRRLMRLDPANADCKRFVNSLLGIEEEPETPTPPKKPAKKKKG